MQKNENYLFQNLAKFTLRNILYIFRLALITPLITIFGAMLLISASLISKTYPIFQEIIIKILTYPLILQGHSGYFTEEDSVAIYLSWVFIIFIFSIILEKLFKINLTFNLKKKLIFSTVLAILGWGLTFTLLVTAQKNIDLIEGLIGFILFLFMTLMYIFFALPLASFLNFISKIDSK